METKSHPQHVLNPDDSNYPKLLKYINDPPKELWARGDMSVFEQRSVAIIGSRMMSDYGRFLLDWLIPPLVSLKMVIVSGLAIGVDGAAHRKALEYGGKCIAVLGSGLDNVYPRMHQPLMDQIINEGGCVLSEHPPSTPGLKHHFPMRNRIIAGLVDTLFVIEARESSGTLITVKSALDEGREVVAFPGNIFDENCRGTNNLIFDGLAQPVSNYQQLEQVLQLDHAIKIAEKLRPALTGSTADVYALLAGGINSFDELKMKSKLKTDLLNCILSVLELDGYIKINGNTWHVI